MAWMRGDRDLKPYMRHTWEDLVQGMIMGASNMIGIGVATATAGVIVGTVTLTGIGDVLIELVEYISGGSLILILLLTAFTCLVLGMGLPTTANYIVVSALMAPVIVELGAQNDLVVPLIAVHMFVFYFGILPTIRRRSALPLLPHPPLRRSSPIRTGVQGFIYDIRTAILPFMFLFNTELLLINVDGVWSLLLIVCSATLAMLVFAAATQGHWLAKSKWWETIALLLVTFTLFRPGYWMDMISHPYEYRPGGEIRQLVDEYHVKNDLRIKVRGKSLAGDPIEKTVLLNLPNEGSAEERLEAVGLSLNLAGDLPAIGLVDFGTPASKAGIDYGWEIVNVQLKRDRSPNSLFYIPALILLGLIALNQRRRQKGKKVTAT